MPLLILFVAIPIIEIGLFIQVGGWLGLWPTLGIVILTAIIGTYLLRLQGMAALARLQNNIQSGQSPMDPIVHGAMILVAGVLLLTPGFFTDAVGFALLMPPVRALVIKWGAARFVNSSTVVFSNTQSASPRNPPRDSGAVEGDFVVLDDDEDDSEPKTRGNSGWTKPD